MTQSGLFDDVPGPSPWYLRSNPPRVSGFTWVEAGKVGPLVGKTILKSPRGPVLVLDFHNYVSVNAENQLLIWNQRYEANAFLTPPVDLVLLDPALLEVITESIEDVCELMKTSKASLHFRGEAICETALPTTIVRETLTFTFPSPLCAVEELLMLCHSSGIEASSRWERSNLALLVAHPRASNYILHPQTWFNNAGLDYGYQWVTRVARDRNGRVHGEGIRIAPFVLDRSLEQCA